jgi:heat-inducible transcriptional repressor
MTERRQLILNTIIKEHIRSAAPVGSNILVEKYKLDISPATVRNEMAALEEDGYIAQPHTSAGRIPTEKAYKQYIENFFGQEKRQKLKAGKSEIKNIDETLGRKDEIDLKETAKLLSHLTGNTVFWGFHRHNLYYTGISQLFAQPEFSRMQFVFDISTVIDRMDEIVDDIFEDLDSGVHILIGSENPFGNFCSAIVSKYKLRQKDGVFGLLAPMRMDYNKNLSLIDHIYSQLNHK